MSIYVTYVKDMGLDLGDIIPATPRKLEDFRGKAVAVDAFNSLYQFLAIIRQPDGTPLKDSRGRVTSHLSGLLYRTSNLLQVGIKPVFIFDGKPPKRKAKTIKLRAQVKERAEKEWQKALEVGDMEKARSKAMQTSRLTEDMANQSKNLIKLMGIPLVQAPGEGEAQASYMAAIGVVFAAASQDYDSLLFGAPTLIRNLAVTGRRKLPRKNIYVDVQPEEVNSQSVLATLNISREKLIEMGILIGTDFNDGVRGVGPKKALNLVKKYSSFDVILDTLGVQIEGAEEIKDLFMNPNVIKEFELQWDNPDQNGIKEMLCGEHNFSEDRVSGAIEKIVDAGKLRRQKSLDQWF